MHAKLTTLVMTPERDQQISALFHAAREMPAGQRASFVAEACGGDKELRQKVEALLEGDARAGDFLKQPLHAVAEDWSAAASSPSRPRHLRMLTCLTAPLLGRYRILSRLGAGGMGEVFLAEDTQLDRRVAVKLLPAEFTTDARSAAPLHPRGESSQRAQSPEHPDHSRNRPGQNNRREPAFHRY